jgi:hypothetical protein
VINKLAPSNLVNAVLAWCPRINAVAQPIIAGGFIRAYYAGEKPADLDLYFRDDEQFNLMHSDLVSDDWDVVFESSRAITFRKDKKTIQLIRFCFGPPEEIIKGFDFTVCSAAFILDKDSDSYKGTLYIHDNFFEDLAGRVLVYNPNAPSPLSSFKRAIKYVKRGYHICDENIIRISEAIARMIDFDNQQSVEENLNGMDPDGGRRIRVID